MARPPFVGLNVRPADGRRAVALDIVRAVADAVAAGRLPAGCRLPPVRALEHQLGISKNTVQAAYDELAARGLLLARERDGVFVAAPTAEHAPAAPAFHPRRPELAPIGLDTTPVPPGVLSLSTVFIDPALLPIERLQDCFRSVLAQPGLRPFYDPRGHRPLREAIARRLVARGMDVAPDDVLITSGSQQALDLVGRTLARKRVALEDPVYAQARLMFDNHGASVLGLPLDPFAAGVDLDAWERAIAAFRPALLYAITSYQNPTGNSYATHELEAMLAWSERHGVGLLEDDWGSDMLSGSDVRPTLRALGGRDVLYVNSFTKKVLPALRLGFLVAPPELMPTLIAAKRLATLATPPFTEEALCEFLERGYYDTHLAALQAALDRRYHACLAALAELMPPGVRWTTPGGGPTLWLEMPPEVDLARLRAAALARGVHLEASSAQFAGAPHLNGFRVSYAFLTEGDMRRALGVVREALEVSTT
ncbi:MAG: PLP-dependent aminotransferase family protein [Myxococcales bacterium]|nr:PLP-dependent aminotransferase family protein [Myxococcales bacterium]MCB9737626.1 PLP-dependent aminotransferase family protein [Deltaproteobacteria bacterium]